MLRARENIYRIILFFITCVASMPIMANSWIKVAPGINYQDLSDGAIINLSHIHVFKVDLKKNQLSLAMAKDLTDKPAFAYEFARANNALIALNGGFFDKSFHPLGLRISDNHQYSPLKHISWWGIFSINNHKAQITNVRNFKPSKNINFAVQTGPRLIIQGKIPSLKAGIAQRSALGITSKGKLIILVTQNSPLTTSSLANILKSPPLNCVDAINLDGGGSSQIFANIGKFKIDATGFSEVSDAILIKAIGK
ncbi:MAG: phosphodiester glycosidase family protein [Legionellaceae bacterium]|nr:phosphodiester glycosidase family protein [Legionellaceae bacterium]